MHSMFQVLMQGRENIDSTMKRTASQKISFCRKYLATMNVQQHKQGVARVPARRGIDNTS